MDHSDGKPDSILRAAKMIWFGLLSSPILLLIVVWIVAAPQADGLSSGGATTDPVFLILCLAAIADFVIAQQLQRFIGSNDGTHPSPGTGLQRGNLQKGFSVFVIRLALFEAIAVMGFAVALLRMNVLLYLPFLLLSLAGLLASSPSETLLRRLSLPKS